MGEMVMYFIG